MVARGEVVKSIDRAIEAIHFQATCAGGQYTKQQRANLQKLLQHRKTVVEQQRLQRAASLPKREAPPPPSVTDTGQHTVKTPAKRNESQKRRNAPMPPVRASSTGSNQPPQSNANQDKAATTLPAENSSSAKDSQACKAQIPDTMDRGTSPLKTLSSTPPKSSPMDTFQERAHKQAPTVVPQGIGTELVEQVRRNTELSYEKSRIAVGTILAHLRDHVPSVSLVMEDIMKNLLQSKRESSNLEESKDAARLQVIFSEMAACKDDSQQRSWALHEDESIITEYLQEMLSILTNANPDICKNVIATDNYEVIHNLVLYYQMETRVSLRLVLLQVFGALCGLESTIISELLTSVLPLELARDMQTDSQDIQKLLYSALVLTMVFSMGEAVPIHHYEHLNLAFLKFLLDNIENTPDDDDYERIPDAYINLLLAFNLHFQVPNENLVMQLLADAGTAKTFTEKIMLLVNRGDDPVHLFEHEPRPPDSLLKFMSDLYSSPTTAGLLYTNDAKVLIDIVIRQLADLSPGDKMRTEYLSLAHLILKNSEYGDHRYRSDDLKKLFMRISQEEEVDAEMDRLIVKEIWREFTQYFS